MKKIWLIFDCNFLCYRALYSTGQLTHEGDKTGVIYGFLKAITMLQDIHGTPFIIFCWDYGLNKRKAMLDIYKENRRPRELTADDMVRQKSFDKQVKKLRECYLPIIGFANNFYDDGYESDDIIAVVCKLIPKTERAIIISADHDFYQLLRDNIALYNPNLRTLFTHRQFTAQYGIKPVQWPLVKAIAGCATDNVPGVKGVGEITAVKYVREELKYSTKAYKAIVNSDKLIVRNLKLVQLPLDGIRNFKLRRDHISSKRWHEVTNSLGMKSLRNKKPNGKKETKKTKR